MGRWVKRAAAVLGLGVVVFVFGYAPFMLAGMATTRRFQFADRENAGLTPASFQLAFEDVAFKAADGVGLKGWWVPAPQPRGTVVLVHGLNRSRIEMVRKVPFLNHAGWNALLFDLRHHGESGGTASTFGDRERLDVQAAKAYAGSRSGGPIVFWGISLGGAAAPRAAAEDPGVAGLVCDSTYRSLRDTVAHHMSLLRGWRWWLRIVPPWPVASEVVWWMGRRGDFNPDAVDLVRAAAHLGGRPALFVCNSGDRRMPPEIAFELKAAAGESARVLVVPGNTHGGAWRDGTAAYEKAVGDLLQEAVAGPRLAAAR
jgi:pimeloyl-ACP methyl ester carboxylesterase